MKMLCEWYDPKTGERTPTPVEIDLCELNVEKALEDGDNELLEHYFMTHRLARDDQVRSMRMPVCTWRAWLEWFRDTGVEHLEKVMFDSSEEIGESYAR